MRLLVAEEAEGLLCGFAAFCFVFLGGSLTSDMGTSSNLKCLSSPIRASSFCTILNSSSVKRSCPGPQPRKQALGRARVEAFARLFGMTSAFLSFLFGMALGCRFQEVVPHPPLLLHLSFRLLLIHAYSVK